MEFISLPPQAAVALESLSAEYRLVASGFFDGSFDRSVLLEQIAQDRSEVWREVFQPGYHKSGAAMHHNAIVYAECVQTCAKYAVNPEGWTAECIVLLQRPDRQRVRRPLWILTFTGLNGLPLPPD